MIKMNRIPHVVAVTALVLVSASGARPLAAQQAPPKQGPLPSFRSGVNLILVDVTVRDKAGAPVKGLRASDFQIFEGGRLQDIVTFAYEEIAPTISAIVNASMLSKAGTGKGAAAAASPDAPKVDAEAGPLTSEDVAGHRLWVLLFDTSSMQPEDVQKAVDSGMKWATEKMSTSDLVGVLTISSTLQVLQDLTNDKAKIIAALSRLGATDGTAPAVVDASTAATDEATNAATSADTTTDVSAQELDSFNNDMRLRGLKTVCDNLLSIQQHKAILYFSSGMQRNGSDNQVELRATENACSRANASINPVDSRGLQAVVPGGNGRSGSRGGVGAFSGRNIANQFARLAAQQETLQALAADTGGTAFTDSNDFGEAFDKVEKEISAYYILGYASSNTDKDGGFRRISVRLKKDISGTKLNAREGYYADRDFTHTAKADREEQIQEQLMMAIPATDVPLFVTAGYFRLPSSQTCTGAGPGPGRGRGPGGFGGRGGPGGPGAETDSSACYYVPISLAVPGTAVPKSADKTTLDVRGRIMDERGFPVGTIKDTLTVPPASTDTLANRQVLYQTGTMLPAGRFSAKIVVRENTTGRMGTFEMLIVVPELSREPVKVSSVVLSTQLQSAVGRKTQSPLVRDGLEIVPNLTHVVSRDQKLYFYYEVYDPGQTNARPQVRTSLAFYRGKVKVFETPMVERTALDALDRKAAVFQFEIPAADLKPGLYTCQVNIIDDVAGKFAFPRLDMYVR
jgi:VWFA-related protein